MKNTTAIIVAVLLLAAGVMGIYALRNQDTSMTVPDSMVKTETVGVEKVLVEDTTEIQKQGGYEPFTAELLANSAATRRVLFFYANWCPTCASADASFTENSAKIPSDVTLIRVNYNDTETDQAEKDLSKKYGITYQHTFVQIDASGNEVAKWNGGEIDDLLSKLK